MACKNKTKTFIKHLFSFNFACCLIWHTRERFNLIIFNWNTLSHYFFSLSLTLASAAARAHPSPHCDIQRHCTAAYLKPPSSFCQQLLHSCPSACASSMMQRSRPNWGCWLFSRGVVNKPYYTEWQKPRAAFHVGVTSGFVHFFLACVLLWCSILYETCFSVSGLLLTSLVWLIHVQKHKVACVTLVLSPRPELSDRLYGYYTLLIIHPA